MKVWLVLEIGRGTGAFVEHVHMRFGWRGGIDGGAYERSEAHAVEKKLMYPTFPNRFSDRRSQPFKI